MKKIGIVILLLIILTSIGWHYGHKVGWERGFSRAWSDYERGFNDGLRSSHNIYKREHQTSEYQYRGFSEDLIKTICEQKGIDYEGSWLFSCPKCREGGARIQHSPTASIYYGWHHRSWELEEAAPDVVVDPNDWGGQTYCEKCLYPLGTDWKIIDLSPVIKITDDVDGFTLKDCVIITNDPNDFIKMEDWEFSIPDPNESGYEYPPSFSVWE